MDHSIIPHEWKTFLSKIQEMFPTAIIAGGAIRDTIVENEIKDVDIYIHDKDFDADLDLDAIAAHIGVKHVATDDEEVRDHIKLVHDIKDVKRGAHERYATVNPQYMNQEAIGKRALLESYINYIVDVNYNGVLYQLIFIEIDPILMVHTDFDFNICKVYFDGKTMTISEEFWYDMENKQLTISGRFGPGQLHHTMFVHRENLIKKFPGWKVVVDDLTQKDSSDMPPSYIRMLNAYDEAQKEQALRMEFEAKEAAREAEDFLKRPNHYVENEKYFEPIDEYRLRTVKINGSGAFEEDIAVDEFTGTMYRVEKHNGDFFYFPFHQPAEPVQTISHTPFGSGVSVNVPVNPGYWPEEDKYLSKSELFHKYYGSSWKEDLVRVEEEIRHMTDGIE